MIKGTIALASNGPKFWDVDIDKNTISKFYLINNQTNYSIEVYNKENERICELSSLFLDEQITTAINDIKNNIGRSLGDTDKVTYKEIEDQYKLLFCNTSGIPLTGDPEKIIEEWPCLMPTKYGNYTTHSIPHQSFILSSNVETKGYNLIYKSSYIYEEKSVKNGKIRKYKKSGNKKTKLASFLPADIRLNTTKVIYKIKSLMASELHCSEKVEKQYKEMFNDSLGDSIINHLKEGITI